MARCNGLLMQGNHIYAPHTTVTALADLLRRGAGRQVIDKTGLDGFYDIEFWYAPGPATGPDAALVTEKLASTVPADAPEFFTAVRELLGLKLEPSKTSVEVLVVDSVERPTEN